MLRSILLGVIFLCFIGIECTAQNRGFIGKRHEVSIDLIEVAYEPSLHLNYKYALLRHLAVMLEYSYQRYENYSGQSYGLGILSNSQNPQMEMPIGYYAGAMFSFNNGSYSQLIESNKEVIFKNNGQTLKIIIGKDTAILPSISLDINAEIGYKWGYYYAADHQDVIPNELFPRDNYLFNASRFRLNTRTIDSATAMVHTYARFLVMPRLKIGFMF